jgi:hypothetical protein
MLRSFLRSEPEGLVLLVTCGLFPRSFSVVGLERKASDTLLESVDG